MLLIKVIFCIELIFGYMETDGMETDEVVFLSRTCSLEKGLFICLTVYYVKDLTYLSAFGQTLGLIQSSVSKGDVLPPCWASSKLLKVLDNMKGL